MVCNCIWVTYFHQYEFCCLVGIFRGYNIGIRLIDEFLAKSNVSSCVDFRETAEVIAKVLFGCLVSLDAWEKFLKIYPHCDNGCIEMALPLVRLVCGSVQCPLNLLD